MERETIHEVEDESAVTVQANLDNNPVVVATFDGDERVSEWKAALQKEDEIWFAEGYAQARSNYREPYQSIQQ